MGHRLSTSTGTLSAGGCDRHAKCAREEPPHIWSQGQKPGGPHARRAAAKRSYPTSEVRGSGRECQTPMAQERLRWPRGATPCPRSEVTAGKSYSIPLSPRPGAAAGRNNPMSKEWWLRGRRRAYRSHPTLKVRKGSSEDIPLSKVRSSSCTFLEQP